MNGLENITNVNGFVDETLTSYSERYIQDASTYISSAVATPIPVQLQSGKFLKYPKSYFLRDEMAPRPHGGTPVQVRYGLDSGVFAVDEYAAEHIIDDRDRATIDAPGLSLDMNAVTLLTQKALIRRDRQWATTFFKTGVWGKDYTGVASGPTAGQFIQWDQAGANPLRDISDAQEEINLGTGRRPNTLVLGANTYAKLRQSQQIMDLIKYTQRGVITLDLLAEMFDVERVLVARAVYNAADETGATKDSEDIRYIVDADGAWLGYVERTPAMDAPTAAALFLWVGLEGGLANSQGGVIRRGRDDRASSDWFQIKDAMQYQAIAPELGVFFTSTVTPRA